MNLLLEALDEIGLALVEHGHVWTVRQRQLYENAISSVRRMEIGLPASEKCFPPKLLTEQNLPSAQA